MEELIFACLAGSHMYGTEREDSDTDIRGVQHQTIESLLGTTGFEQWMPDKQQAIEWSVKRYGIESDDITIYGLTKFFKLCLDANPNILELLFASPLEATDEWRVVLQNRHLFLSEKIIHTFSGYAFSQLKRIKVHHDWLQNPPVQPDPYSLGLERTVSGGNKWKSPAHRNRYKNMLDDFHAYTTWLENRNRHRSALEAKYGYDTKHASHLYRLIFEAHELLTTGKITLPLRDSFRNYIMHVYNGGVTYEEVVKKAEGAKDYLASIPTILPHKPNKKEAEKLLIKMNWEFLKNAQS